MLLMKDLITKNLVELKKISKNLQEQLFVMRFQKAAGQQVKVHKQKEIKKDIARILTAINIVKSNLTAEELLEAQKVISDSQKQINDKIKANRQGASKVKGQTTNSKPDTQEHIEQVEKLKIHDKELEIHNLEDRAKELKANAKKINDLADKAEHKKVIDIEAKQNAKQVSSNFENDSNKQQELEKNINQQVQKSIEQNHVVEDTLNKFVDHTQTDHELEDKTNSNVQKDLNNHVVEDTLNKFVDHTQTDHELTSSNNSTQNQPKERKIFEPSEDPLLNAAKNAELDSIDTQKSDNERAAETFGPTQRIMDPNQAIPLEEDIESPEEKIRQTNNLAFDNNYEAALIREAKNKKALISNVVEDEKQKENIFNTGNNEESQAEQVEQQLEKELVERAIEDSQAKVLKEKEFLDMQNKSTEIFESDDNENEGEN